MTDGETLTKTDLNSKEKKWKKKRRRLCFSCILFHRIWKCLRRERDNRRHQLSDSVTDVRISNWIRNLLYSVDWMRYDILFLSSDVYFGFYVIRTRDSVNETKLDLLFIFISIPCDDEKKPKKKTFSSEKSTESIIA